MSRHWKISSGHHFQNGHHNTTQIQHFPISSKFYMWVDNDVPTLKNFFRSPFSKWPPQYRKNSTLSDFNDISYVGRLWCPEFIPDIEKFLVVRHNAAQIQHCPISTTFHVGRLWCPDIDKFLAVTIFKMATTIPHKFNIVRFQRHFICG